MSILEDISSAVLNGKRKEVKKLVPQALEEGVSPQEILDEGLIKPMGIIGDQRRRGVRARDAGGGASHVHRHRDP